MLNYDEQGAGGPVVLLHGFPLSRLMWRSQLTALAKAGFRVICPDLPGFGESPPAAGPVTMSGYADAVIDLLDHLGIERAVVGGMSMGGYVLLNLVERYPERLVGAMFMVTRASADDPAAKEKRTLLAAEVNGGNHQLVPETFATVLFAPGTSQTRPELIAEVRQWMESVSPSATAKALLAMRDRADYIAKLAGFKLPALVVGAEQDLAVPPEHSRILAEGLPDARLCLIPNAGHMANLEQPALFNEALIRFLRQFDRWISSSRF
jgi:pimeloyl-ACP methyl ester carboxylesterase